MITPLKYPLAKLLKEKGFEYTQTEDNDYELGRHSYSKHYKSGEIYPLSHYYFDTNGNSVQWIDLHTNAPNISDIVMWLYEKHGIWIECNHCGTFNEFTFKISELNKKNIRKKPHYMNDFGKGFRLLVKAYEAAIEYTLNNLINNEIKVD